MCSTVKYACECITDFTRTITVCQLVLVLLQVHLDHKHMGLGGDDSWTPCVHDKYLVPAVAYSFSIRLSPLTAATSGYGIYKSQMQNWVHLGTGHCVCPMYAQLYGHVYMGSYTQDLCLWHEQEGSLSADVIFFHEPFVLSFGIFYCKLLCEFYGMTWIYYFPSYVGVLVDIIYVSGDRKFNIIVMHVSLTLWKLDSLLFLVIS